MFLRFLSAALLFYYVIKVQSASAEIITKIQIDGNNRIKNETIIEFSGLKIGQNTNKYTLNNALKQIYRTGNFADVSINQNGGSVSINVIETPIIGDIFFIGSNKFDQEEVKKSLSTKSRQVYSKSRIKLDTEKIQSTFKKMGFLNAEITPKAVFLDDNSVDIIFNINEGKISYIDDILFSGNKKFSAKKLKDTIMSKQRSLIALSPMDGGFVDENFANDAVLIEYLYKDNGYAKAKVVQSIANLDKQNYNFTINYSIDEGDVYSFGKSHIVSELSKFNDDKELQKLITTKEEKQFSISEIKKTVSKITMYLKTKGYENIRPVHQLIFDDNEKKVDILYHLNITQKVYIDRITISGNNKTKSNVILRELMINEGDIYDKEKIELSRDRIYMLGYFKNVEIKEILIPNSDLVNLEIVVDEQFFGRVNFSIGYSGYYGIIGDISLSISNFLGRGFSVNTGINRSGYMESYSIGFYDPYMFGDKYNIGFGANASFSRFGNLGGGTKYLSNLLYKGYSYAGGFNISFELVNRLTLTTSVNFSKHVYKLLGAYGYQLYQQLIGTRNAQTFGLTLTYNQLNRARFATNGYMLQYNVNFGGMGITGGQQFIQNTITAIANVPIFGEDLYIHLEGTAGILNNLDKKRIIGMENLFTLGGYTRMRGFDFYGIGPRIQKTTSYGASGMLYYATEGNKFYYMTGELRTPLFIPKEYGIYFFGFVDAGSVWGFSGIKNSISYESGGVTYKETVIDSSKIRVSAGAGVMWQSSMFGEIGFYYAKPIIKQPYDTTLEFGITMGRSF